MFAGNKGNCGTVILYGINYLDNNNALCSYREGHASLGWKKAKLPIHDLSVLKWTLGLSQRRRKEIFEIHWENAVT